MKRCLADRSSFRIEPILLFSTAGSVGMGRRGGWLEVMNSEVFSDLNGSMSWHCSDGLTVALDDLRGPLDLDLEVLYLSY